MPHLEAVIFDLDGVIVSTDNYHYLGWKRLADEIGVPFDREKNEQLRGVDRMGSLLLLLPQDHGYTQEQLATLADRKNGYYKELIKQVTPNDLLPGAVELLDELEAHDVKKAVGSASRNADAVLKSLGIRDRFGAVITGHDFEHGKPEPDVFLTVATRLKADPENCVVFEDAAAGIEAAHAAGMKAVGVGRAELVAGAERIVKTLAEISYADIVGLWAERNCNQAK